MTAHEANRRVLVVDDDEDIRDAMRDALEDSGYEVSSAADGGQALERLASSDRPALILLDWNMAPMNAPQFMEAFTQHPEWAEIPVVLVSADSRIATKATTGGYAGCLTKPVKLDVLLGTVAQFTAPRATT